MKAISITLIFLLLVSCSNPLDRIYNKQTISQDLYDLRKTDSLAVKIIKEQLEFADYMGFSYGEILNDFDNRVSYIEKIIDSIKNINSERFNRLTNVDYLKVNDFKITKKNNKIYLSGSIKVMKNISFLEGEIYLEPKSEVDIDKYSEYEYLKSLECNHLDADFISYKSLRTGDIINFSGTNYSTFECSIDYSKYEKPKIDIDNVVFTEENLRYTWSAYSSELESLLIKLDSILTYNAFLKIIEKNGANQNQKELPKDKSLLIDHLLRLNGINFSVNDSPIRFSLRKIYYPLLISAK